MVATTACKRVVRGLHPSTLGCLATWLCMIVFVQADTPFNLRALRGGLAGSISTDSFGERPAKLKTARASSGKKPSQRREDGSIKEPVNNLLVACNEVLNLWRSAVGTARAICFSATAFVKVRVVPLHALTNIGNTAEGMINDLLFTLLLICRINTSSLFMLAL